MIEWFAFAGMILGASAGMFGTYALGFYDGVKDGERIGRPSFRVTPQLTLNPDIPLVCKEHAQ
jgi:hypothetical protein